MSQAIVTAYALYLRAGPAKTYASIGLLYKDERVEILDSSPDSGWKKLRAADGKIGWSSAKYLRLLDAGDGAPAPPAAGEYKVTAYALYMREGPGSAFRSLGYLRRDETVSAIAESPDGQWKQIRRADGLVGWSSAKYLRSLGPPVPPPDNPPDPNAEIHYQVTAYALYVRQGPGSWHPALTYVREGDVLAGLSESADGLWKQVRLNNGVVGWSSGKYLRTLPNAAPPFEPAPDKGQFRVSAALLHFRAAPTTDSESLALLPQNTIVDALGASPDGAWQQVQLADGRSGWCASQYLYCLGQVDGARLPTGFHRCIAPTLNVYAGPDTSATVLTQLIQEETVNALEVSADGAWKKVVTARGLIGWCLPTYLISLGDMATLQADEEFPWMPIAFNDLGLREFAGPANNPRILEYMASTNLRDYPYLPDETEWCAAFVNWNVEQAGIEPTGWATVYPWMAWGDEIKTPRRGCLVTFQWDDGGQHVAFYLGECGDRVRALGGNQSSAVWIKSYPKRNVVNYRIPKGWG